ncbi:MAG: hypothetical protein JXO44_04825, partial [Clostridia bacterium]|nr:hypothetical protein [Clostridia bacterium]
NDVISIDQNGLVTARNTTGASTVVVIAQDGSKTVAMLPVEVSATETPTPPVPPAGTVTVTFDTGDYGSKVAAQLLDAGDKITSSTYTDRYGYDFEGWLLNGSAFDIDNTPITASIELVADWSLKTERYSSDPLLVRDDRFAQGYPKMELVNDTWMLKVKLADAAPAKVSMVFSRYMDDTDTTCVLHGHLGYSDSGLDAADYYKTASLSDTDEHVFNTGVETSEHNRLIGSAFVVDQGGSISAQPTVVISPGLITSTLDNVAPEARHAFLSIDKSKIVLDFDEDLDGTTTVDPADFSFTGLDGASVTRAYRNQDEDKFVLEVTGFDNYQEDSGLVFKYTGDDLKDEVGNVVTTKDLEDVELVHFVVPRVTKVALDSNGQGVGTFVSGSTIAFAEVAYYENTRALDVDSISGWRSSDSLEEYSKLDAVFDSNNISNLHVKVDFNGDVMTLLGNVDVIEDTGATEVKVTDPVS